MTDVVMIDGRIVPTESARVSVFDRGFLYGDSVFESLRAYRGVPFALDAHLERLAESAERVFIPLPVGLAMMRREIAESIDAHRDSDAYIRITLTRGIGESLGLDPLVAREPLRVILVRDLVPLADDVYERGVAAITYRAERPGDAAGVSAAKTGNYLLAVLAQRAARECGAREALIEDARGFVLEGATSNLFAVRAGALITAPTSAPVLPGITRGHVLAAAHEAGMAVEERETHKSELAEADEMFVCSSLRELVPVVELDGKRVGSGVPGPITHELLRRYRALTQRRLA